MKWDNIAATGTTGSIGSFLPNSVSALKTRLEDPLELRIQELQALPTTPDGLIHLAAMTSLPECAKDPELARERNVMGALKWYQAAKEIGIPRFVFVSTSHVYAPSRIGEKVTTHHPLKPKSFYGELKLEAEELLKKESLMSSSCELLVARVFSVLSPIMRPGFLLTGLHNRAIAKDYSPIPGLDNVRDFLAADEVADKLMAYIKMSTPPPIANICSGKETTVRQIAEEVFKEHHLDPNKLVMDRSVSGGDPYIVGDPTF